MKAFHEVRKYDSDFAVWCREYENISFLSHWHDEIEWIYVRSGSIRVTINEETYAAKEGDVIFCDSGYIHYSDSYDMRNVLDFLIFNPKMVTSIYEQVQLESPLLTREFLEKEGLSEPLKNLYETVRTEIEGKQEYYQKIVIAALRQFWYLLKRKLPAAEPGTSGGIRQRGQFLDIQNLIFYFETHYSENITLEFAADQMNLSPSHFSKVFKKMTGINFVNYLNMVRVEQAISQLRTTENKITSIAFNCGFNNIRTFNRVFKEITGYSPSQFHELPDTETYMTKYLNRKSHEQQMVGQDSVTLVNNDSAAMQS